VLAVVLLVAKILGKRLAEMVSAEPPEEDWQWKVEPSPPQIPCPCQDGVQIHIRGEKKKLTEITQSDLNG
jgi:hypothetical protein